MGTGAAAVLGRNSAALRTATGVTPGITRATAGSYESSPVLPCKTDQYNTADPLSDLGQVVQTSPKQPKCLSVLSETDLQPPRAGPCAGFYCDLISTETRASLRD